MKEGKIEIFLSCKEPIFKDNIMWLRPYLNKEGYELLYYGANGWTVFVPCCSTTTDDVDRGPCVDNTDPTCKCTTD